MNERRAIVLLLGGLTIGTALAALLAGPLSRPVPVACEGPGGTKLCLIGPDRRN